MTIGKNIKLIYEVFGIEISYLLFMNDKEIYLWSCYPFFIPVNIVVNSIDQIS